MSAKSVHLLFTSFDEMIDGGNQAFRLSSFAWKIFVFIAIDCLIRLFPSKHVSFLFKAILVYCLNLFSSDSFAGFYIEHKMLILFVVGRPRTWDFFLTVTTSRYSHPNSSKTS